MLNYFLILIFILTSVAFFTIMERKLLGSFHIRLGPNKVGFMGIFQPFSDALKLFSKNLNFLSKIHEFYWNISPVMTLVIFFFLIIFFPLKMENNNFFLNFMFMIFVFGMPLFTLFWSSFFSLNKFSLISSKRFISQMLSYEMGLMLILIFLFIFLFKFNLEILIMMMKEMFFLKLIILTFLFIIILMESSRIPFDFVEGESELVSGFNIEYSSAYFSLFFIYEYGMMLYFSILISMIFFYFFFFLIFIFFFIHIRSSFPRMRYDQMMNMIWKFFYPILMSMLIFMKN